MKSGGVKEVVIMRSIRAGTRGRVESIAQLILSLKKKKKKKKK